MVEGCCRRDTIRALVAGASFIACGLIAQIPAPALATVVISAGTAAGGPGTTVTLAVSLQTGGASVGGTQNDLFFDPVNTPVDVLADGAPDCAVNPAIHREYTQFAFEPPGCSGAACTSVRAIVLSFAQAQQPIADGAVLYTCQVHIAGTAASGNYPVTMGNVDASDPTGNGEATNGADGLVIVGNGVVIAAGTSSGAPGATISFEVSLHAGSSAVAGTENDLLFDPVSTPVNVRDDGTPDCALSPAIHKEHTEFAFEPPGCSGTECTSVRAIVLSIFNTDPIPDGSVLYTCQVHIAASAANGSYPVTVGKVDAASPTGESVAVSGGVGLIIVAERGEVVIAGSMSSGAPGTNVYFEVSLQTGGAAVAGTQNDLFFDPVNTPVDVLDDGTPDCGVNPAIHKDYTQFAFEPPGCSGTACTSVRAIVLSAVNVDPIPDGSVLDTCAVHIAANAASGDYSVTVGNVGAASPAGESLLVSGADGLITVGESSGGVVIAGDMVSGVTAGTVSFAVSLHTGGASVAGTQNDLFFDMGNTPVNVRDDGTPDCVGNPAIHKDFTDFAFQPFGCSGAACTSMRAIVVSLFNVNPIPDGSVLYTCQVNIAANAASGSYPVTVGNVFAASPTGASVPASGRDGAVIVGNLGMVIVGDMIAGAPGTTVSFAVSLHTGGTEVAGTQNDLLFDPLDTPVHVLDDGTPDCAGNPAINKEHTEFGFQPPGCAGTECTGVRAIVISVFNTDPIPDGSVLYTCQVDIGAETASGSYPVPMDNLLGSTPDGEPVPASAINGAILVGPASPTPIPTPTATSTTPPLATPTATIPSATSTPGAAATASAIPSATSTAVDTPTATATPSPTPHCVGDCGGQGSVSINDLVIGVNIALGEQVVGTCEALDLNGDGKVDINELVAAVNNALEGCSA
jgi:hypothetical protein